MRRCLIIIILLLFGRLGVMAQGLNRLNNIGRGTGQSSSANTDSVVMPHPRKPVHITIYYQYLNSVAKYKLDTSIDDFYNYLPLKPSDAYIGNLGTAVDPMIAVPDLRPGFDAGFHAFDRYEVTLDSTRYFNTTKPYTTLSYMVGTKNEQMIGVFHTQSPSEKFNFGFSYRKINSPGYYKNQNTDENGYNIFARYNTQNQRYNAHMSFVYNKMKVGENGGVVNDSLLSDPLYSDRRTIPTYLGGDNSSYGGFLSGSTVATASMENTAGFLYQHSYDWGSGDSIKVNDTLTKYEFHPFFRIQHTFKITSEKVGYSDAATDSAINYYNNHYGFGYANVMDVNATHNWKNLSNDISLVQFPSRKNEAHFIKAGATYESISGDFLNNSISFSNLYGHFEYQDRTLNDRWDIGLHGQFYFAGHNFGDYIAAGKISRFIDSTFGNISIAFSNSNQTPAFVYRFFESNRFVSSNNDLKNENFTLAQFKAESGKLRYDLTVNYYLLTNYTYFKNYYESAQYSTAFPLIQVIFHKDFKAGHFHWYADFAYQQTDGAAPINVPTFWTRDRFAYANALFHDNLDVNTGIELQYNTPYYADDYSPVMQQFVPQRAIKIQYKPSVAAFFNFRIKTFNAYARVERLNTFLFTNNLAARDYPYQDWGVRVGIKWAYLD